MNTAKWVMLGLVGCALLAFGYMVHLGQRADMARLDRGPISVAAVRGGTEPGSSPASSPDIDVDYNKALNDEAAMAQKVTDKFNAATKGRMDQVKDLGHP